MTQKSYEDLLVKVNNWPYNRINGLLLEQEIIAECRAGQYGKDQEEYLLRTLRQRVDQAGIPLYEIQQWAKNTHYRK
jgi:hypothetical protein